MQLEDYFDFLDHDDIRIRGSRIGIECVLEEHYNGKTPEEIAQRFPSLGLENIYAVLLYSHHEHMKVLEYYARYVTYCAQSEKEHAGSGRELKARLYAKLAERSRMPA